MDNNEFNFKRRNVNRKNSYYDREMIKINVYNKSINVNKKRIRLYWRTPKTIKENNTEIPINEIKSIRINFLNDIIIIFAILLFSIYMAYLNKLYIASAIVLISFIINCFSLYYRKINIYQENSKKEKFLLEWNNKTKEDFYKLLDLIKQRNLDIEIKKIDTFRIALYIINLLITIFLGIWLIFK